MISESEKNLFESVRKNMTFEKIRGCCLNLIKNAIGGDELVSEYIFLQLFSKM
jgi:hypothetical protein